jgi:hypothetical protein
MFNRITFKRLATLFVTAPALLTGAAHAQNPNSTPSPAAVAKPAPKGQSVKIATYIKMCCFDLMGYNQKGEVLLQSQEGQPFTLNEAGQRTYWKHTHGDISDPNARVPHKEVTSDISIDAAKAAPKAKSGFIKFSSAHKNIEVVGITEKKQTVFKNQRGETFTINPLTGDFIFFLLVPYIL